MLPNTASPLARTLKLNGYSTAQFGKCHEVPVWETSPVGPFDAWPTGGGGFEYFYGFIGGEAQPVVSDALRGHDAGRAEEDARRGLPLHGGHDRQGDRLGRASRRRWLPDKPFFMYFAPGATHAPHHVPKEWADKYKGKFDSGWDKLREETFARQKALGVIPQDCRADRPPQGDSGLGRHARGSQAGAARQMEVYAGFLEYTDHHVGRLLDALEQLGILDDTLIYYIIGDNGASAEGTLHGTFNEMINFNGDARAGDAGVPDRRASTSSAVRNPTTTTRSAGRTRWTRPTSGPSRSPRTGAARATARSSTGRTASRPRAKSAPSSITSSTSPRRSSRPPGCPSRNRSTAWQQMPIEGVSMRYSFDDANGRRAARDAVLRDVRQPRHLSQGLDGGDPAQDALAARSARTSGLRRRRLGTLRHDQGLDAGQRPLQGRCRRSCTSCSGCG